jgi:probable phosphoglycerate mutase
MIEKPGPGKFYIGQSDLPLSAEGHEQAETIAEQLQHIPLNGIYTSDLVRTVETASYTARSHGLIPIQMPELREIHLGQWEGRSFESIKKNYPDAFFERGRDLVNFRPPGGESFMDLSRRVIPAFYRLIYSSRGEILIVAHAGVNRIILSHVMERNLEDLFTISQNYGTLKQIRFLRQRFSIIL